MRKRKFADGGEIDPLEEVNNSSDSNADETPAKTEDAPAQTFKQAFAAARKDGGKTFMWNGKKYTTELASAKKTLPTVSTSGDSQRTAARKSRDSAQSDYQTLSTLRKAPPAGTSKAALDALDRNIEDARMKKNRDSKIAANPGKSVVSMKGGGMVRGCGAAQRGLTKARSK